jgi:hypothetical protein
MTRKLKHVRSRSATVKIGIIFGHDQAIVDVCSIQSIRIGEVAGPRGAIPTGTETAEAPGENPVVARRRCRWVVHIPRYLFHRSTAPWEGYRRRLTGRRACW